MGIIATMRTIGIVTEKGWFLALIVDANSFYSVSHFTGKIFWLIDLESLEKGADLTKFTLFSFGKLRH
jgi:hypothetical protein